MPLGDELRARAGRLLEIGVRPTPLRRAAALLWELASKTSVKRPLHLPAGLRVIGVGGAVLGGAGKTPVAIALARELARLGENVALVSHAYRASPGRARRVRIADEPCEVGDDALASARLLDPDHVPVISGPSRSASLELARSLGASIAVVDGLLQASPVPLTDSILVLDALAPWGSARCPPLGDLRAPREALLLAADHVAVVTPSIPEARGLDKTNKTLPHGAIRLPSSIAGARGAAGRSIDLAALKHLRAGLILAIARPDRIRRALEDCGIEPAIRVELADHAALTPAELDRARPPARGSPDIWLTTARCATKLPPELWGAPVLALDHRVEVGLLLQRLTAPSRTPPPLC